jgi:hypothetical protein
MGGIGSGVKRTLRCLDMCFDDRDIIHANRGRSASSLACACEISDYEGMSLRSNLAKEVDASA